MQIIFQCPACEKRCQNHLADDADDVRCSHCEWTRQQGAVDVREGRLTRCRVCGCRDLWRQKDFPPAVGLSMVAAGIILSSIAWARYEPAWAIGILMMFALVDLILYTLMSDRLVCYRCQSRHCRLELLEDTAGFDLEVSERYRQQRLAQEKAAKERTP